MKKNNIIIAGVPRAGKSTLAHQLSRTYGYQHVSMDAIVAGMESIFPELGIAWWPSKAPDRPPLDVLRAISPTIARFIQAMLQSGEYDEFTPGMVMDVCQLFPRDYVRHLQHENCEICYLITANVTPQERYTLLRTHDTPKDHTYQNTENELRDVSTQLVTQSQYIKSQCVEYGLPYYETAQNRPAIFESILQSLR